MALVLNEEFPGRQLLRAAILVPWAISEVATATAWIFIVNPTFGALTGVLNRLGIVDANHVWIDENTALYWVAAAFVWHITPLGAFFFLAALQTVPEASTRRRESTVLRCFSASFTSPCRICARRSWWSWSSSPSRRSAASTCCSP